MSHLIGNPKHRFSHDAARILVFMVDFISLNIHISDHNCDRNLHGIESHSCITGLPASGKLKKNQNQGIVRDFFQTVREIWNC